MTFQSILFGDAGASITHETPLAPAYFADLNLDQVVQAITASKKDYNLKPFFHAPLYDPDLVEYRQEVARDLEDEAVLTWIKAFAQRMSIVRRYQGLIAQLEFQYHKEGWLLETVAVYCQAVSQLAADFPIGRVKSRGLLAFRDFVAAYVGSQAFAVLQAETTRLKHDLSTVAYCVLIRNNTVKVRRYEDEIDYSADVEQTFMKFKQGSVKDYTVDLAIAAGMNHVEAQILEFVARLYPEIFAELDRYCAAHERFLDETLRVFDREIQFYVAYHEYIAPLRHAGLKFCYPEVSSRDKTIHAQETYDIALAHKQVAEHAAIICNDFYLEGPERILVISGPNQGGKTTFARMFGQLHHLASLGCAVPGSHAQLFLPDQIFTHFEKEEDIRNLRGKLQDDLVRMHHILDRATPDSIIIMNEIFTSTTLADAVFLGQEIMARIVELDALCVCVTFIDELASFSPKTVSMVSTVVPDNPALRTFKIVRRPADGLAYALSIAEKHRLTYSQLKERIQP